MKILMTADCVGGVWTYALELCRALQPLGAEVILCSQGARLADDQRHAASSLWNVELHESAYRLEWMPDPWADVERAGAWLLELAADARPDVVHLNDYAHAALAWHAPVVVVAHSCVSSWFEAVRRSRPTAQFDRYLEGVRGAVGAAEAVVSPSRAMLRAFVRHHGSPRRALVIPNGRDPSEHAPGQKEPYVLAAGRLWDEAKNVAAVERAAGRLCWPVYLAGDDGGARRGGDALPNVQRLGRLSSQALAGWFSRASLFAHPARYEPFGLAALEAAQAGCALVLGDLESQRELWDGAAAFVDPEDGEALVAALQRLIASPEERAALAERGRAIALGRTPGAMARAYFGLYRELAQAGVSACAS